MTKTEYIEKRKAMQDMAQNLIDEGKLEEAKEQMTAIDELDNEWDKTAQALADLRALSDNQPVVDLEEASVNVNAKASETINLAPVKTVEDSKDAYVNAWAKQMMGKSLTADEQNVIDMVNAYTHTTGNTGLVIPDTVANGIWDMAEELYPLWADAQKTYVNGNYTVPISDASTAAAWYDEATATADAEETFRELTLTGRELSRAITVSWKLREMAIADFIPFIQKKLAQKMGAALGYGVSNGRGVDSATPATYKPEPVGICFALKGESETPQIVKYDSEDGITYEDLTKVRAKVTIGTNALAFYAKASTIWTLLANVKDNNGRPIMVADPINGGVNRIFGIPVKEDDSMTEGEVLLGAPSVGYIANVNKDMSIMSEEHVKARTVDYCAYAIVDGGVISTKAFGLLIENPQ